MHTSALLNARNVMIDVSKGLQEVPQISVDSVYFAKFYKLFLQISFNIVVFFAPLLMDIHRNFSKFVEISETRSILVAICYNVAI